MTAGARAYRADLVVFAACFRGGNFSAPERDLAFKVFGAAAIGTRLGWWATIDMAAGARACRADLVVFAACFRGGNFSAPEGDLAFKVFSAAASGARLGW